MAKEQHGTWFGFGFCGFGQVLGSGDGRHSVDSPEPLCASEDVCRVSASWSYTALVTRGGRVELSGSVNSSADGCRDAWASEGLLVVLRDKDGSSTELRAWTPGSALQGEPLWVQNLVSGAEDPGEDESSSETRAGTLPLLPRAHAYVNPQPPFCHPLAPELRVRQLELGAEHVLMLCEAGQVFSWGGGRHGQLGHGTLEAELEPRLLEALQGLRMAEVAAGGWHSVCVSETGDIYIWGWNESGQLALPVRNPTEDKKRVSGAELNEDCLKEAAAAVTDVEAPAPFIAIQPFPALLDLPMGSDAVRASCGSRHTAVVTPPQPQTHRFFLLEGNLPSLDVYISEFQHVVSWLVPVQVVSCLISRTMVAATYSLVAGTGELYTWGWDVCQTDASDHLGVIATVRWATPKFAWALKLPGFTEGQQCLSEKGTCYILGKYGQLGHKDSSSLDRPCRVEYFAEKQLQVRAVTCGPWNTYVYAVEREEI